MATAKMKVSYILQWRNSWSGETGFVKKILEAAGHFENTYDANEARRFTSVQRAEGAITTLAKIGEADLNEFKIVQVSPKAM